MDDLISRKAVRDGMMKYGFHAPDMTVHEFVEDELPSVPAVPLEMVSKKLGSLCRPCMFQTVGCPSKSFDCDSCNTSDAWEKTIIKWMEEEDADD